MSRLVVRCLLAVCTTFIAAGALAQSPPPGFVAEVDMPDPAIPQSQIVLVRGFAYDVHGLTRIELYVDAVLTDNARLGFPRIDAIERYGTQYPGMRNMSPGFHASFPGTRFSRGRHSILLRARNGKGTWIAFGQRTIFIDNTVRPEFDIPDPGGIARIAAFLVASAIFVSAIAAPRRKET
jgi:hypothetical protein